MVDWAGDPTSSRAHPTGYFIFNYAELLSYRFNELFVSFLVMFDRG
jgi:hypothetical protein